MGLETFRFIRKNQEIVLSALQAGEFDELEGTQLTVADGYVLYALREKRLGEWQECFPDPRKESEIETVSFLTGGLTAAFHGYFSQTGVAYGLRSHALLEELGYGVEILEPGSGMTRRGTELLLPFTPDAVRKWLDLLSAKEEKPDTSNDEHLEDCREGYSLLKWYNECVGPSFRRGSKTCVHLFDGTVLPVNFDNENYEGSGITKHDDGSYEKGYKAGLLKTYVGQAEVITGVEIGPIQRNDTILAKRLLLSTPVLKAGDIIIYDRGLIDGELMSDLKTKRKVDVIVPVKSNMIILDEAKRLAEIAEQEAQKKGKSIWNPHPFRKKEAVTFVCGLEHAWDECKVGLNGALVRFKKKNGTIGYLLFVTTDLSLKANQILRSYRIRVEIEEDNRQVKRSWEMGKFTSTSQINVVFQVVMTLAAYSLFTYYNGTKKGKNFCQKTLQSAKRHESDSKNIRIIMVARGCFVMLRPTEFALWLIELPGSAREKLAEKFRILVKNTDDLWPFELGP